jgi:hypothetical protein
LEELSALKKLETGLVCELHIFLRWFTFAELIFLKHDSVNFIAPKNGAVALALQVAKTLAEKCSPDAVQGTLRALRLTLEMGDAAEGAVAAYEDSPENRRVLTGENIKVCGYYGAYFWLSRQY